MDISSKGDVNEVKKLAKKLETVVIQNEEDGSALNAVIDESSEFVKQNSKNPLVLIPVIRCFLKFLTFEELKNFRLVCREWDSAGLEALASRTLIRFKKYKRYEALPVPLLPKNFQTCFLESASLFSAFKISGSLTNEPFSGDPWTIEELSTFFNEQQKSIKELTLKFKISDDKLANTVEIGSWISKSLMVKNDVKYLTKLSINGNWSKKLDIPFHLIAQIKDLSLSYCEIKVESGIKLCPVYLKLAEVTFIQDGIRLGRVIINDLVDFQKAKEVALYCMYFRRNRTEYVLDLQGNISLDNLTLESGQVMNGERSHWNAEHLAITFIPYTINRQMKIKELFLSHIDATDLFSLPNTVQKLTLNEVRNVTCSQPIKLEYLQYLHILMNGEHLDGLEFLSHFKNCPRLTFLKLSGCVETGVNSLWMPMTVKTLTLDHCEISWLKDSSWNLEKLVVYADPEDIKIMLTDFAPKIQVEDFVVLGGYMDSDKVLFDFLEHRKRLSFGKKFYVGDLSWKYWDEEFEEMELENSVLKEEVDIKASFYVFEIGERGRAVSKEAFYELIPNHLDFVQYEAPSQPLILFSNKKRPSGEDY